MSDTKHIAMNAKQHAELESILKGICKERKTSVAADLETRLSYREKDSDKPKHASWDAYSRFLLEDGHTVYVSLRTMKASVSKEVDKFAQGKIEKRQKREAARLLREETKAAKKETTEFDKAAKRVKAAEAKPKVAKAPMAAKKPEAK
jgi:hypothetical protein